MHRVVDSLQECGLGPIFGDWLVPLSTIDRAASECYSDGFKSVKSNDIQVQSHNCKFSRSVEARMYIVNNGGTEWNTFKCLSVPR